MSKRLSWVVGEFYGGSVRTLWIMCSTLMEGLRNESVASLCWTETELSFSTSAELALLVDIFFSPGLCTS